MSYAVASREMHKILIRNNPLKSCISLLQNRKIHLRNEFLRISEEVQAAVQEKRPVVALETTIYTHGYPYPENLELALRLEALVRANGAVPATCGILNGIARVGMGQSDIKELLQDRTARKVSRRDFGFTLGSGLRANRRLNGGTTISGTMVLAHLAGIKVFATGGLGGVHRGGESTMDVSADLTEFAHTPVAVISSGCKGFLDIPRTLEYLETQGAPVATFADGRQGQVDFPAFWSRDSGVKSPMVVQDEVDAAAMIYAQHALPLASGQFFANPVPVENEIPLEEISIIIEKALDAAAEAGITGSANTPFVLDAIRRLSEGRSIPANTALVESNVVRGSRVAVELSKLEKADSILTTYSAASSPPPELLNTSCETQLSAQPAIKNQPSGPVDVLVAGSLAVDLSCDYSPISGLPDDMVPRTQTSNPAIFSHSLGGVGCNIANAVRTAGASVRLCSVVANDITGKSALEQVQSLGMDTSGIQTLESSSPTAPNTAQYLAVNDAQRNLVLGMADIRILEAADSHFTEALIADYLKKANPKWAVIDTNWDAQTLRRWIQQAKAAGISVALEPVSIAKSTRLFTHGTTALDYLTSYPDVQIDLATPNIHELEAMHTAARAAGFFDRQDWWRVIDFLGISSSGARTELIQATSAELVDAGVPQMCIQLLPFLPCILTKLGADGVLLTQLLSAKDERLHSPQAAPYILSRAVSDEAGALDIGGVYMRHFKAVERLPPEDIVSVNGAGDTFMGVLIAKLAMREAPGLRAEDAVDLAQSASVMTLKSPQAVSPEIAERLRRG